jgi:DNA-directed RNA polymerase
MTCNDQTLFDQQIALEYESLAAGQERYWRDVNDHVESKTEHTTGPVMALIKRNLGLMIEALEKERDKKAGDGAGKRKLAVAKTKNNEAGALAFIALREAFAAASSPAGYTAVARRVGIAVNDEITFDAYQKHAPKEYKMTQHSLKHSKRNVGVEAVKFLRKQSVRAGTPSEDWSVEDQVKVGVWLLEVLVKATGLFRAPVHSKNGEKRRLLVVTDECMKWIKDSLDKASLFCPVRLPMVVPPAPWTGSRGGGYLTDCGGALALVKTRNKAYLAGLDDVHMPQVYDAINAIQSTAWQINGPVLDVALALWAEGRPVAGLPNRDPDPIPAQPAEYEGRMHECKKERPDLYKPWALKAAATYDGNAKLFSKRLSTQARLNTASKFRSFDAIYFPHELDFRGRIYPAPAHLSPQGDDLSKALLRFSSGKTMGARGFWWLRVHLANCFGVDKVAFEERVAWTEAHMDDLLESAVDPIGGSRFWTQADDPFLALAACFELAGYLADPVGFQTHISIPMDGSCNGLQNFSALLRDAVGGKATNLMPSTRPADIYSEVSREVSLQVCKDATQGNVYALAWEGKITRKIVKQPVMTLPYGATKSGMRSQIEAALLKNLGRDLFPTNETWAACTYLADATYDCIGRVVIAARTAMDWLRDVAKLTASEDYPIHWTTPVGLPVLQDYRVVDAKRIQVFIDGKKGNIFVNAEGTKLDKKRQSSGVSPNFIHSLDAAHLMRTVNLLVDNGVRSFAMIHDSYGVHACDTDLLHVAIREAFIEQYERNVLGEFMDEIAAQIAPEMAAQLPPLPPAGTLELASVREARYFFA